MKPQQSKWLDELYFVVPDMRVGPLKFFGPLELVSLFLTWFLSVIRGFSLTTAGTQRQLRNKFTLLHMLLSASAVLIGFLSRKSRVRPPFLSTHFLHRVIHIANP